MMAPSGAEHRATAFPIDMLLIAAGLAALVCVIVFLASPPRRPMQRAMVSGHIAVGLGSALRTAIRVVNAAFGRLPCSDSRLQRRNGNAGIDRTADGVANDAARPRIAAI